MAAPIRVETTLERRGRSGWKELMPREHGLWGWLAVPSLAALASAAGAGAAAFVATVLAVLATIAGLGAAHGLGRVMAGAASARGPAGIALLAAQVLGALAVWQAPRPGWVVLTLGLGALAGFGVMAFTRGRPPRQPAFEAVGIAGFTLVGAGLTMGAGVPFERVVTTGLAVFAWLVVGLWWVKGQLAKVLSNRLPWQRGVVVSAVAIVASIVVGIIFERPLVGLLPLAYLGRATLHARPTSGKDAKRLGLTELAWGVALALAAGLSPT